MERAIVHAGIPAVAPPPARFLSDLSVDELRNWLTALGEPAFRATQIHQWLWKHLAESCDQMTNLPIGLRETLVRGLPLGVLREDSVQHSVDGTTKWAFRDDQGFRFETVMIPDDERRTACISSQIGCAMGCSFCRTAAMGFVRNLTSGEMLQQVAHVRRHLQATGQHPLSNIVFMGMGEPLNNLDAVLKACDTLVSPEGMGMSPRRITISTSGLVGRIAELAVRAPQLHLAVSLNGSSDEMRDKVMPINRRYPIAELLNAVDAWSCAADWPATYEYVLIGDVTCTPQAARELVGLLRHRRCKLNLIPLNASDDLAMRTPGEAEIEPFERIVRQAGLLVFRRKPKGRDILAACGQLALPKDHPAGSIRQE